MFVYHDFIDCKIQVHTCIVKFYLKKKNYGKTPLLKYQYLEFVHIFPSWLCHVTNTNTQQENLIKFSGIEKIHKCLLYHTSVGV